MPRAPILVTVAQQTPATVNGTERTIAFVAGGIGVFSVLCFLALIVAGVTDFSGGAWPAVETVPYIGFPIVVLLILALLIVSAVRRTREARAGQSE